MQTHARTHTHAHMLHDQVPTCVSYIQDTHPRAFTPLEFGRTPTHSLTKSATSQTHTHTQPSPVSGPPTPEDPLHEAESAGDPLDLMVDVHATKLFDPHSTAQQSARSSARKSRLQGGGVGERGDSDLGKRGGEGTRSASRHDSGAKKKCTSNSKSKSKSVPVLASTTTTSKVFSPTQRVPEHVRRRQLERQRASEPLLLHQPPCAASPPIPSANAQQMHDTSPTPSASSCATAASTSICGGVRTSISGPTTGTTPSAASARRGSVPSGDHCGGSVEEVASRATHLPSAPPPSATATPPQQAARPVTADAASVLCGADAVTDLQNLESAFQGRGGGGVGGGGGGGAVGDRPALYPSAAE